MVATKVPNFYFCCFLAVLTFGTAFVKAEPRPLLGIVPNPNEITVGKLVTIIRDTDTTALTALKVTITTGNPTPGFTCPLLAAIVADPKDCASLHVCSRILLVLFHAKLTCDPGYHYDPNFLLGVLCVPNTPTDRCCRTFTDPANCTSPTASPYNCSFCLETPYGNPRCDHYANLVTGGCDEAVIYNKTSGSGENRDIGPHTTETEPVNIALLPGEKKNFTITVQLEPWPLDLYFLLDITGSMVDDKNNIASLASALVDAIGNLTTDFGLGLGVFTDKYDVSVIDYHHMLTLSNDTSMFSSTVSSTPNYNGYDLPEDSGTAMIESTVCSQVGWRDFSRKMLLVVTDAEFHYDTDGTPLTAGRPAFDGLCHLNATGFFNETSHFQYPSKAQIAQILNDNKMTVVLAVTSDHLTFYQSFANQLVPVGSVGTLSSDASNILDILKTAYNNTVSKVEMQNTPGTPEVQIRYFSNCQPDGSTTGQTETTVCTGLPQSGEVVYTLEVALSSCPPNGTDYNQNIEISAAGLPRHVDVALHLVCGY